MRRAINIALLALACALSAHAADRGITLDVRISPVVAGEILSLHLHGMGRITQEQLQTLSFRVGERRVQGDAVNGDDVYLQTPGDLRNGAHVVKVIRHDPVSDRDITLFEKVVEFAANEQRTLGRATVDVGVAGSTLRIDDIAEIELGENVRRTLTRVTVVASTSTLRQRYLVHDQVSRHLPAIAASLQLEVETTGELRGGFALRLKVPKDYLATIPTGYAPEVYALIEMCDDYEYEPLQAAYDASRGLLIAHVPASVVLPERSCDEARGSTTAAVRLSIGLRGNSK